MMEEVVVVQMPMQEGEVVQVVLVQMRQHQQEVMEETEV